jgi:cell wall-associated NlpC family hydrolase
MTHFLLTSLRPFGRAITVASVLATLALPAWAQGPAQQDDPAPAVRTPAMDGARLLAANLARLSAASAPKPLAARPARPFAAFSESAHAIRDSLIVSVARTALGTRYTRGGQSFERGFDCSGLVRYIMTALHVAVPRTAAQQAGVGLALGRDTTRLRPGDLLTFGRDTQGISHVGIYVGGGRFVHASSVAGRVIESEIRRPRAAQVKPWRGTRRFLSDADADAPSSTKAKGDS